jgi:ABC-type transporter Mla MlaB component
VISTRRACLDREDQQVETSFLKGLEQTTRFQIQDDILRLYARGRQLLTFKSDATRAGGIPQEARVTGTVTYLQRIALPPGAVLEVKLLDVSRADAAAVTIAQQLIEPAGRQVPIAFELRYDPSRIEELFDSGSYPSRQQASIY